MAEQSLLFPQPLPEPRRSETPSRPARREDETFHPERAFLDDHPLPHRIAFTEDHHRAAQQLSESRQRDCEAWGSKPAHGFRGGTAAQLRIHRIGAYGECGYATYAKLTLPVYTGQEFSMPDFGEDIQVRTRTRQWHELYRRQTEPPEWRYVLVTLVRGSDAEKPTACYIRGWLPGVEMERPDWMQTHGNRDPAWFAPTASLRLTPVLPKGRNAR
tara:strand:+ start:141 stop:785 length:645 start_codon:yes stop_codon:yes gene_type:complete